MSGTHVTHTLYVSSPVLRVGHSRTDPCICISGAIIPNYMYYLFTNLCGEGTKMNLRYQMYLLNTHFLKERIQRDSSPAGNMFLFLFFVVCRMLTCDTSGLSSNISHARCWIINCYIHHGWHLLSFLWESARNLISPVISPIISHLNRHRTSFWQNKTMSATFCAAPSTSYVFPRVRY